MEFLSQIIKGFTNLQIDIFNTIDRHSMNYIETYVSYDEKGGGKYGDLLPSLDTNNNIESQKS